MWEKWKAFQNQLFDCAQISNCRRIKYSCTFVFARIIICKTGKKRLVRQNIGKNFTLRFAEAFQDRRPTISSEIGDGSKPRFLKFSSNCSLVDSANRSQFHFPSKLFPCSRKNCVASFPAADRQYLGGYSARTRNSEELSAKL